MSLPTSQNLASLSISHPAPDPALPQWVHSIPGADRLISRLGKSEFRRRLLHMSPALIPVGLPFIPHQEVWGGILLTALLVITGAGLTGAIIMEPLMRRRNETSWLAAVFGYVIPVVAPIVLMPGRAELGLMTLQIIALGDGSATLGGKLLGGWRLPWNSQKTFSGMFCFFLVGSLAATYSYWGEIRPTVDWGTAFAVCSIAAICAAIVESLPIRSNDNLRVGTTALLAGLAASSWIG